MLSIGRREHDFVNALNIPIRLGRKKMVLEEKNDIYMGEEGRKSESFSYWDEVFSGYEKEMCIREVLMLCIYFHVRKITFVI